MMMGDLNTDSITLSIDHSTSWTSSVKVEIKAPLRSLL